MRSTCPRSAQPKTKIIQHTPGFTAIGEHDKNRALRALGTGGKDEGFIQFA